MTPRVKRALEAALGLAVLGLAVGWLSGSCAERVAPGEVESASAPPQGGRFAAVEARSERVLEWASGAVASARHTSVSSRMLARIEEVRVSAGSAVAVDDVLVVLDARDLASRVGEAEEMLRAAEARADLARRDHARAQDLFRKGVVAQQRIDQVTAELRAATAELQARKQSLGETETGKSFAEIRSPVAGRVVDRLAEPGDTAVPGQPLMRIYDPSLLRVEAPVRESLAVGLAIGQTLRVEVPALAQTLDGQIDELVPFAEPGARTLLVKVRLPRTDASLFAGMYARVGIPAGTREQWIAPAAAIERVGQLEFVRVAAEGGAVERRLVTTGRTTDDGDVEVLSGLRAGERVHVPDTAVD